MDKTRIDIGGILKLIKKRKWTFCKTMGIAFVIGLLIGFSMPKQYTSSVQLAPETSRTGLTGDLNSLASMVGVNLNNMNKTNDAFYPKMYPNICASNDFVIPLWNMQIKTIDGNLNTTLYDYLAHHQKQAWWWSGIGAITSLFGSSDDNSGVKKKILDPRTDVDPFHLTSEQSKVAGAIRSMIKCSVDKKTDIISITVTAQDPMVAAQLADTVHKALQVFITDYRTTKARQDLEYMEKLFDEARTEYEQARLRYTSYADSNSDLVLESYKAKQEDLENNMQLRYNIYSQMAQRVELAKAKVQEETPAFSVIQSATVPLKKSKPKRMTIALGLMMLTFIGTLLWLISKEQNDDEKKVKPVPVEEKKEEDDAVVELKKEKETE